MHRAGAAQDIHPLAPFLQQEGEKKTSILASNIQQRVDQTLPPPPFPLLLLTLQVCPSSRAALWASTGLSMTRPVRPEKSMATREFSDTLRCGGREGGVGGVYKGQRSSKPDTVTGA